jgi:hypothetical protein
MESKTRAKNTMWENFLECACHSFVTNLKNKRSDEFNFCDTHTKFGKFWEILGVPKN